MEFINDVVGFICVTFVVVMDDCVGYDKWTAL